MTESQPFTKDFVLCSKVVWGRPNIILLTIFSDKESDVAPLAKNDNVETLCIVEADLSHIPDNQISQHQGANGMMYYVVNCQIEICCELGTLALFPTLTSAPGEPGRGIIICSPDANP